MSYVRRLVPLLRAIGAFAASIAIGRLLFVVILPALDIAPNQMALMQDLTRLLAFGIFAGLNVAVALLMCRLVDRRPLADFRWGITPRAALLAFFTVLVYVVGFIVMLSVLRSRGLIRLYPVPEIYPAYVVLELASFLLTGIWEETLYRGYVFNTLRAYGRWPAYALSMLLFAVVHFTQPGAPFLWWGLANLLTAAFALTYVYDKTGSIWAVALIHGAFDFISVFLTANYPHFSLYTMAVQRPYNAHLPYILLQLPVIMLAGVLYLRRKPAI